jgi:hypothetical protein
MFIHVGKAFLGTGFGVAGVAEDLAVGVCGPVL